MKKILFTFLCLAICHNALAKDHKKGFIFVPENVVIETVENVKRIEVGLLSEAKKYYDRMMKKQGELSTAAVNEAMCVFYE